MKRRKGYLLPMAIVLILFSTILGMGILYLGGNEQIAAIKRYYREKAFYIAEAGINRAFAYKKANESWHPEQYSINFAGGSFIVTETIQGDTVIYVSTGTYRNRSERVSIVTVKSSSGHGGSFGQGIYGNSGVTLINNAFVDGYDSRLGPYGGSNINSQAAVGSRGVGTDEGEYAIYLANNAYIRGTAMVEDPSKLYVSRNSSVTYKDVNHQFGTPFDDLPDVVIPSDLTVLPYPLQGDPRIQGVYSLVNGKLTIPNNQTVTISGGNFRFNTINMNNNNSMYITGNTRMYVEQGFTVYNNGSVILQNNSELVLYLGTEFEGYPLILSNNATFNNSSSPGKLRIYVQSFLHPPPGITYHQTNIWLVNNSSINNAVLYAPGSNVLLNQNAQFSGGMVAGSITAQYNNSSIHYDIALRDMSFPDDPGLGGGVPGPRVIVRWTKPDWANRLR